MQVLTPLCGQNPVISVYADRSPIHTALLYFPNTLPVSGATLHCADTKV